MAFGYLLQICNTVKFLTLKVAKKIGRIFKKILFFLFIAILLFWILLQFPFFQNFLAQRATKYLSKQLGTEVKVENVTFGILNRIEFDSFLIKDKQGDTLLFAGNASSTFTDFFIFKDNATLNSIKFGNVEVNLLRKTDSVWNYQFLVDYFSSSGPSTGKKQKPVWTLKDIDAKNVKVFQLDKWLGKQIDGSFDSFVFRADSINFENQQIALNELHITKPIFRSIVIPALKVKDSLAQKNIVANQSANKKKQWDVNITKLVIADGYVENNTNTLAAKVNKFDGRHIGLSNINLNVKNFSLKNNTIKANIVKANATERCGFTLQELSGLLTIDEKSILLEDALIKTPQSELKKYVKLSGENIIEDLNDVVNKIYFNTNFDKSYIDPRDIAYFTNALPPNLKTIKINGEVTGKINNLVAKNISIATGELTKVNGDITITNITDRNSFLINLNKAKVATSYNDVAVFYSKIGNIKNPDLKQLGVINYEGNATIKPKDYVANGLLSTALGTLNLNGKFSNETSVPNYSGAISTNGFALGKLLNNNKVGEVAFDVTLNGQGLTLEALQSNYNIKVKRAFYNGKLYENITSVGSIKDKLVKGSFKSDNDYLNGATDFEYALNGNNNIKVDTKQFTVDLQKILNLPKPLKVSGNGTVDIAGKNLDEMLGNISLNKASLLLDKKRIDFKTLKVKATKINGIQNVDVNTDEFDLNVNGNFLKSKLPQTFQSFLYRYFPNLIKRDASLPKNQNFTFNLTTRNISDFVKGYYDKFEGLDNATASGNINTSVETPSLHTEVFVPYFAQGKYKASNISLVSNGDYDSLKTAVNIGEFFFDTLLIPDTKLTLASSNDVTDLVLQTTTNSSLEKALLQAQVHSLSDGVDITFRPSNFLINNKNWTIEDGGTLALSKSAINTSRVKIFQGIQEIEIYSDAASEGNKLTNKLDVNLKHINLSEFMPYILKTETIEGDLSGNISIQDPFGDLHVVSNELILNEARFNGDSIGQFKVNLLNYLKKSNDIIFETSSDNENYRFTAGGKVNLKNADSLIDINLDIDKLSLKFLNKYLSGVFYGIKGFANGFGRIYGSKHQQFVTGNITTKDAGLGVNYTKCFYKIRDGQPINFTTSSIEFNNIVLEDKDSLNKSGTPRNAILNGTLKHNFFKNFGYDFYLTTANKARGMHLLNTTENDNEQFYGYAVGNADVTFTGEQNNMKLLVDNVEATERSNLTLPDEASFSTGLGEIKIRETSKLQEEIKIKTKTNIDITVNARPTPLVKVKLIIDGQTGDAIDARGEGNISMSAGTNTPLALSGSYVIGDSSNYNFTLNNVVMFSFFDLNFKIKQGGTIKWSNSPYDAEIDLEAAYSPKDQLKLSDLNPNGTTAGNATFPAGTKSRVNITATLTEKLFKPKVKLGLDLIDNVDSRIKEVFNAQVKNDSVEVLRQASTVIVLNRFFPLGNGIAGANNSNFVEGLGGKFLNTLTGQISSEFSRFINQKIFKSLNINFDAGANFDNYNVFSAQNGLIAYFKLSKNLWQDRIVFHADSDFGFDFKTANQVANNGVNFLPNLYIDFLLNSRREVKLSIYYKSGLDFNSTSLRNRMGATLRRGWDF